MDTQNEKAEPLAEKPDFRVARAESILILAGQSDLAQHPLSAAFPAMPDDDFEALKQSIRAIGIQSPIVLFDGMVLDGWHRYKAGKAAFMRIPTVQLGDVDPVAFVVAANAKRRHLTPSQLAFAVAEAHKWTPSNIGRPRVIPGITLEKTNAELAALAGVSIPTISMAKAVQTNASPEVQVAVKSGEISLKAALAKTKAKKTVAPKAAPPPMVEVDEQSEIEELREHLGNMAASLKKATDDNQSMGKVFDADDKLSAATGEIARLNALVNVYESRFNGLTNELNEAKRLVQHWKRRAERAEAALPQEVA